MGKEAPRFNRREILRMGATGLAALGLTGAIEGTRRTVEGTLRMVAIGVERIGLEVSGQEARQREAILEREARELEKAERITDCGDRIFDVGVGTFIAGVIGLAGLELYKLREVLGKREEEISRDKF